MRIEDKYKGGQFAVILAAFLLFYKIRPYFFWHGIFDNNYFNAIITIILGILFLINLRINERSNRLLFLLFSSILVSYPFVGGQNFNVFVSIAPLVFLPFASIVFCRGVYSIFLNIYCFIICISLFFWLLSIIGFLQPYKTLAPLNEIKDYYYKVYPFLVRDDGFRFCGPFDEPGVVGTVSGLLFCCQNKYNTRQSIILLLSGLCSFSLFFFIIVAFYYSYNQLVENGHTKNILVYIIVIGVALIIISISPVLSKMIIARLSWDADTGMFSGDNRTSSLAWELFDEIKGTRAFWFGIEDKWEFQAKVAYSSSFLNVILMNGMLFFLLVILFYTLFGWVYKKNVIAFIVYMLVIAGTIYQRPLIFNPVFIFLWTYLARKDTLRSIPLIV